MSNPVDGSAEWHLRRKRGVGGSDLGNIMGLYADMAANPRMIAENKFQDATPQHLWKLKTGKIRQEDVYKSPASLAGIARGNKLEPAILQHTAANLGVGLADGVSFKRHPDFGRVPFQANTDGTLLWRKDDKILNGLAEAKTTKSSTYWKSNAAMFAADRIPHSYAMQVQMYLHVTGLKWGVISCFIGPNDNEVWDWSDMVDFVMLSFRPSKTAASIMSQCVEEFWYYVQKDEPPPWSKHPLLGQLLTALDSSECHVRRARNLEGNLATQQ